MTSRSRRLSVPGLFTFVPLLLLVQKSTKPNMVMSIFQHFAEKSTFLRDTLQSNGSESRLELLCAPL